MPSAGRYFGPAGVFDKTMASVSTPKALRVSSLGLALLAVSLGCLLPQSAEAGVQSSFSKRLLRIEGGTKSERITVSCNESSKVVVNGRSPRLIGVGPLPCARVAEIDVSSGKGNDTIDLRGIDSSFADARFEGFGTGTLTAVVSGSGSDRITCGDAFCFVPDAGLGDDRVHGGPRRDVIRGGGDNDRLWGLGGRDDLLGRAGNDYVLGGDGGDLISGNAGEDRLYGEAGSDLIGGGAGNDLLNGGQGDDRLLGGPGRDRILPGPGKDTIIQDPPRPEKP